MQSWTIGAYIGAAAFVSIPLLCGWMLFKGLRDGAFRVKGSLYSRIDDPITFWMTVGSYVACIAVPLGFMIYSAWDIMKPVR